MELFDIVDQLGNPTGETVERSVAHAEGIRHRTAHVWIARKKDGVNQVLLQKRAMNKDSFPGCYDTSSAGHITAGDEPEDSARRELEEELGITADEGDLKFVSCFDILYQEEFHGKLFKDNEIAFLYVYDKPVDEKTLVLQEEELDGVEWFDLDFVVEAMEKDDERFCVPPKGLAIIAKWAEENL
ncbi:MAG: NUDIX domain-containing protein [Lachnospiraceae bacterium]|nr:NUDIX domain-containing protein [Lachnospiraceae bacterium]